MSLFSSVGKSIEQSARQCRIAYRFPHAMAVKKSWVGIDRPTEPTRERVLLDLRNTAIDGEQGRRFHALVLSLGRAGYEVWMVPHLRFLQSGRKQYKWQALQQIRVHDPGKFPAHELPNRYAFCFTDRRRPHPLARRSIRLTFATYRRLANDEIDLPYAMHPDVYNTNQDLRLPEFRSFPRVWELFFGGYRQKHAYREKSSYQYLQTINRFALTSHALQACKGRVRIPESNLELDELIEQGHDGFVFIDNENYRIPADRWLDSLSRAKFFLAAPGTTYPMSHNCVEALAVGTIPILQYRGVFRPALQDGVNCLTYDSLESFHELLNQLPSIDTSTVSSLRQGAIRYYDQYLSPQASAMNLCHSDTRRMHMFAHLAKPAIRM